MGGMIGTPEDKSTITYHEYVKGLEESLSEARECAENVSIAANDQTITALRSKLATQRKKPDTTIE